MLFPVPLDYGLPKQIRPWDLGLERIAEVRMFEPSTQEVINLEYKAKVLSVPEKIEYYGKKHGMSRYDIEKAKRVAKCESGFRLHAKNPNSSASGVFQQLGRFWPARAKKYGHTGASVFDADANIDVSVQMMVREGFHHWKPSQHCRGR